MAAVICLAASSGGARGLRVSAAPRLGPDGRRHGARLVFELELDGASWPSSWLQLSGLCTAASRCGNGQASVTVSPGPSMPEVPAAAQVLTRWGCWAVFRCPRRRVVPPYLSCSRQDHAMPTLVLPVAPLALSLAISAHDLWWTVY